MDYLPLFISLNQLPALVIGGGPVAARKIGLLRAVGARITVVAPHLCAELSALAAAGLIIHISADFVPAFIAKQRLIIAATDDPAINRSVASAANAAGILVNVVDDLGLSSCIVPAIIDRSPVIVACSTAGSSPLLATTVRAQIETLLAPKLGELARFARAHRAAVKARLPDTAARRKFWTRVLGGAIANQILAGDTAGADQALAQALSAPDDPVDMPRCQLVALSSDDPDFLTLGALRGLYTADLVLHDHDVAPAILQYARRDAERSALTRAPTAFEFLRSRTASIRAVPSPTTVVYLSNHAGAWLDLLGGELRAQGFLTTVG